MTAADVSVVTETLPGSQVGLTIEVPSDQVDRAYDRALNRLAQRIRIEGFRPGKAPRPLVEARLGSAAIRDEVVDALIPPVVNQALRDRQIDAIDRPQVEIQELERGRPARFRARVSVMPEVRLPDLKALQVERPVTVIDDEMIERRLAELRERLAQVEPVDREVRVGDVVVADLKVLVDGEEVPSEARTASEVEVREGVVIPELLAALPGHKTGEVAVAEATLPDDHSNPDLRGKQARVEFTVQGVKEKLVPELTDEVADQLSGGEQKTADSLRQAVREDLVAQAARLDELAFEQRALKALVEASQVEIPKSLVDREVERQVGEAGRSLQRRGLRLDRYLEYVGKTQSEYEAELEPDAQERIRVDLVMEELGKQMAINPSEDEAREYMRSEAERDEEVKRELQALLNNSVALEYFRHRLTRIKVLEGLVERLSTRDSSDSPDSPGSSAAGAQQSVGAEAE
ncbi:MAG TPA: trigger factor [Candidatus Dormibacteraeota bacterium]|nr:trigger factor [Candidatus Dormibacteraeota bacterium]